ERLDVPGFLSARRYVCEEAEHRYIALYRLRDAEVLHGEPYQQVMQNSSPWTRRVVDNLNAFLRNEYTLEATEGAFAARPAPFVYMVRQECDPEHDDEMRRWYREEHLARLAGLDGVTSASLYVATAGSPRLLAVYEVASPELPGSEPWREAIASPWLDKMRPLMKNRSNNVGRLIVSV